MFGIGDVHKFQLERSTTHKEAIHTRLACQLFAGGSSHGTFVNELGALSHHIRDVGFQSSPELLILLGPVEVL